MRNLENIDDIFITSVDNYYIEGSEKLYQSVKIEFVVCLEAESDGVWMDGNHKNITPSELLRILQAAKP